MRIAYSTSLVVCLINAFNFTAVYENEPAFGAFMSSHTGQRLPLDLIAQVADYYHDFSFIVSDFSVLNNIVLSFWKVERARAIFVYEPETPVYHFKQHCQIPLILPERGSTKLLLRCSGACCGLDVWFSNEDVHMQRVATGADEFLLTIHESSSRKAQMTLDIPQNCQLSLIRAERSTLEYHTRFLMYSDRNNRPAELRGITSGTVHNIDRFKYLISPEDLPALHLEAFNDRQAAFLALVHRETYTIPQNRTLVLVKDNSFAHDSIILTFRKVAGCPFPDVVSSAVINPINDLVFEVQYERRVLGNALTIQTQPHCQLRLLQASRTIAIGSRLRKQFRYGIEPHEFGQVSMTLTGGIVHSPAAWTQYLETLSEFPDLHFRKFWMGRAYFRYTRDSLLLSVVPKGHALVVHTTTESRREDTVKLTFVCRSECEINLFYSNNGDRICHFLRNSDTDQPILLYLYLLILNFRSPSPSLI